MSDVVERAKAALEEVSDGPWIAAKEREARGSRDKGWIYPGNVVSDATGQIVFTQTGNGANSAFIAASRSLVPELVAEVERLRGFTAALKPILDGTYQDLDALRVLDEVPLTDGRVGAQVDAIQAVLRMFMEMGR